MWSFKTHFKILHENSDTDSSVLCLEVLTLSMLRSFLLINEFRRRLGYVPPFSLFLEGI